MARSSTFKILVVGLFITVSMIGIPAQEKGTGGLKPKKPPTRTVPKNTKPNRSNVPGTGILTIVAPSNSMIEIEGPDPSTINKRLDSIPAGRSYLVYDQLLAGKYRVTVTMNGHIEVDGKGRQEVTVAKDKPSTLTFNLEPVTYDVTIRTAPVSGAAYYALNGETMRMMVEFSDGVITLRKIPAGSHRIEIQPSDNGYQTHTGLIEVSKERTSFVVPLTRRRSEGPFLPRWTSLAGWDAPKEWTTNEMKLFARGQGVGLPVDPSVRHYDNFKLIANVRMLNDMAVSLVLRAQDKSNYYLLQVTGGGADERYVARVFVVRDGVERRLPNVLAVTDQSISRDFFTLTIEFMENRIKVDILTPDGNAMPLGELIDAAKTFTIGAPGIAVRSNEESVIELFHVSVTNGSGQQ